LNFTDAVPGGSALNHRGRLAAALGVLCAGWLAALAAGAWMRARAPQSLQQQVLAVASQLRVPGEQDTITAAASTDAVAQHMRYEIQQGLLAGRSPREIVAQMEAEYGPDVYAAPRFSGWGALAWTAPVAGLAVLLGAMGWTVARRTAPTRDRPGEGSDSARDVRPGLDAVPVVHEAAPPDTADASASRVARRLRGFL
jgi:cytochrome c-type biogenesis protein CcmH/NrfF